MQSDSRVAAASAVSHSPLCWQVRVAEFNESTSFREQLEAVSSTGVYVSVHTSNLVRPHHLRRHVGAASASAGDTAAVLNVLSLRSLPACIAQANAPFLRPGSAAVELIQRNWVWHGLDKSFQVATAVLWAPAQWRCPTCQKTRQQSDSSD